MPVMGTSEHLAYPSAPGTGPEGAEGDHARYDTDGVLVALARRLAPPRKNTREAEGAGATA